MFCQLQLKLNLKISFEEPHKAGNRFKGDNKQPQKLKEKKTTYHILNKTVSIHSNTYATNANSPNQSADF